MMGGLNKLQHTTAQISTQHDVHTTEVQSDLKGQANLAKILKVIFFFGGDTEGCVCLWLKLLSQL